MILFDTHCHLDTDSFQQDRQAVLARMHDSGVVGAAVIAYDALSMESVTAFAASDPAFIAAVGVHPEYADTFSLHVLETMRRLSQAPQVRAIGEIGLDTHDPNGIAMQIQRQTLEAQLDLAEEVSLPVVFHVRGAHGAMLEILRGRRAHLTGGIIHCFSGSWEMAQSYMDLGYLIALGGAATYENARRARTVMERIPLDRLVLETDSPYMPPEGHRGERNEPANLLMICQRLAQIRGIAPEQLAEKTTENARKLYGL
ncbi:MAG: TatD family hydrolase [Clostridia bacterium]|nr:TatD family hydrolase [Clostridia bacterium]